jgi:uncharacterized membrane protein YidH (DUF202 family)
MAPFPPLTALALASGLNGRTFAWIATSLALSANGFAIMLTLQVKLESHGAPHFALTTMMRCSP